jgi:menaquinone-dependent protoporphyrinogen oxidase
MNILIFYGSLEGQTGKISERIAEVIRNKGHEVTTQSCDQLPTDFSPDHFDAAIIGGPIHMGKYPKCMRKFVSTHCDWLNTVPSAFFTVCMAVNSQRAKSREQALRYGEEFVEQSGWRPALTRTFAGAVKYTKYDFITRFIMKFISRNEGGSTDTSRDHEYTDWQSVQRFAEDFMLKMAAQDQTN